MKQHYTLHPEDIEKTLDRVQWGTLTLQSNKIIVIDDKKVPKPPYNVINFSESVDNSNGTALLFY